jgi:hypothetical protein
MWPDPPTCAFCGQLGRPVRFGPPADPALPRLVAGARIYICEPCVRLSQEILQEDDRLSAHEPHEGD